MQNNETNQSLVSISQETNQSVSIKKTHSCF